MVNSEKVWYIQGQKGLRQEDPLSPLLFVLVIDYLTRQLLLASNAPEFQFHPRCGPQKIVSLCIADDLLLFSRGQLSSVRTLIEAFQRFSGLTSLIANEHKYCVYFGGVSEGEQQAILQHTRFVKGDFPMRYLGVPLSPKRWSKLDCHNVVQKMIDRMSCWSVSHLSYAVRLLLVQSVLQSLHSY